MDWKWAANPYCGWQQTPRVNAPGSVLPKPVTVDKGAGGGGLQMMSASANGAPTMAMHDIGGVIIAPPDASPKPTVSLIRRNPIPMSPAVAGKRATKLSRKVGRPFYGP
jgi:hypothetical protein